MNKLGVTLDLNEKSEVDELRRLAVRSDVVIENLASGYLDGLGLGYQAFKEEKPGIVYTSITTFGSWGPYGDYKLTDLVLFHMSGPDWASDERFTTREGREANFPELWSLVEGWTRDNSKQDVARRGQERRIRCFPVNTVEDLFDDGHLRHRGFFIERAHPAAGKLKYPGVPLAARSAPMLGEHNASVLEGLRGQ